MTPQEKLWNGPFGDSYTDRQNINLNDTNAFFERALSNINESSINTVIEFGANLGHNLVALRYLLDNPGARLDGVEVNEQAYKTLQGVADDCWLANMCDFRVPWGWDLALSKGVLIHVHPDDISKAYQTLYTSSNRYILIGEYFNPTPVAVKYRGESEALWKRDFGGDMLDMFPGLTCVDYGFVWSRDEHPQDNVTWWLLRKGNDDERENAPPPPPPVASLVKHGIRGSYSCARRLVVERCWRLPQRMPHRAKHLGCRALLFG